MTEQSMLFRRVLGSFATGVAVVTTKTDGRYFGLTINSFTSVSLEPMLIQINIAKNTTSHETMNASRHFVVNILAEDQQLVSTIFAGAPPAERFDHVETWEASSGCPVIEGSLAYIDVRLTATYDGGDHTIFLGEVVEMQPLRDDASPLLYYRGRYERLATREDSRPQG
ncbi:MAG: flavin reductase family protein [Bacteroidetes bacterium]|nr:flavin reductase family protein [Bacteroidota bacterium]